MSVSFNGQGAALENVANEILRVQDAQGPLTIIVKHIDEDGDQVALSVSRQSDSAIVALDEDTAVSNEDTAYDGDTSTLAFSGESLNNTPIVPGTVVIEPTAGGNSVDATDRDGDGLLYTDDVDEDLCGTIDYFTGALVLDYPTGKAPNTTNITADYTYSLATEKLGQKNFYISNLSPVNNESLIIKAASAANSRVHIEVVQSLIK
jgi:hypothetical protein